MRRRRLSGWREAYGLAGSDGREPAAIRLNYGVQRSENGGTAARAVAMLPLITGSWKQRGGGLLLSTSGSFPFELRGAADAGADAGESAGAARAGGEYEPSWGGVDGAGQRCEGHRR